VLGLGLAYEQKGMFQEAISQFRKARAPLGPSSYLGHAYAVSGQRAEALKILNQLKQESKRSYIDQYLFAVLHARLDEKEQAREPFRELTRNAPSSSFG
jgi:tetratricopeptide (TPR) repeat protein